METYARAVVEKFLKLSGCEYDGIIGNKHVWIKDDVIIIQLPTQGRIDHDLFEFIATEQVGINYWEFDYWLGENT